MLGHRFKVRGNWPERAVACRVAMCLGVAGPLAWEDDDEGAPFLSESAGEARWQLDQSNDYFLRKVGETEPDEVSRREGLNFPVQEFELSYRYASESRTPDRCEALDALCKWLECNLVFGGG